MAWQAPIWGAGAHSAVEAKMSDSALNDNAIFASFAVERNSAISRSALSARRTPIASLARSRRLDCHFGIDGQIGRAKDGQLGADYSLNSGGFGGRGAIRRFDDAYVAFIKALVGGCALTLRTEMPFSDFRGAVALYIPARQRTATNESLLRRIR
jgi:hypothetical protein